MSTTLKKQCEIALAREFFKVPALRTITPKLWDSNARVRLPHFVIQATPGGDELVFAHGIYQVDCTVRVEGKPRKNDVGFYIAEVDAVFAELASLDKAGLEARFRNSEIYVHGVIPRQLPAMLENENRVDMSGGALIARLS